MLDYISNEEEMEIEEIIKNGDKAVAHALAIELNKVTKLCQKAEVPFFTAYYVPQAGYIYRGLFPEEIENDAVKSEHWRFTEFLKTCIRFNKEDFMPVIRKNTERKRAVIDTEEDDD